MEQKDGRAVMSSLTTMVKGADKNYGRSIVLVALALIAIYVVGFVVFSYSIAMRWGM